MVATCTYAILKCYYSALKIRFDAPSNEVKMTITNFVNLLRSPSCANALGRVEVRRQRSDDGAASLDLHLAAPRHRTLDQAAQQGLSHRQNLQRNVGSSVSC